jgi:CDP-glucose 4,6-dehydratase
MGINKSFWIGKRVFITGHTGFKGGWLSLYLSELGAEVYGYALKPNTEPSFFSICELENRIEHSFLNDIRDMKALQAAYKYANPDIVFHLAAQPLVRYSYNQPIETYEVNIMGTAKLYEVVRNHPGNLRAIVSVTTDKCYENREWDWPYRENDHLGGFDPYSSSKSCAEIVSAAYRRSYFQSQKINLATARAGNVIGGGDWSNDRLIPDFIRSIVNKESFKVRSPDAIRPWQHVLEPLTGYIQLAQYLYQDNGATFADAWNFGPNDNDSLSVRAIVDQLCLINSTAKWELDAVPVHHEAGILKLDSSKSKHLLDWKPCWNIRVALEQTIGWYKAWQNKKDMHQFSIDQIKQFQTRCNE